MRPRATLLLPLILASACEAGPALPPRALETSCRPWVDGAPVPTLGETGCFSDVETLTPSPDLVPYAVRSPLWTDGADKRRWVVVPPGATLEASGQQMRLPAGSILIKLFVLDDVAGAPTDPVRMEIRFLVLEDPEVGWQMFTYRFDDDGREARLLDEGADVELVARGQTLTYHFPDRMTCEVCHYRDRPVLGFSVAQVNFRHDYGPATRNQLLAMVDVGLLEPLEGPVETLPTMYDPASEDDPVEGRARSWLHTNCAHCHRPGGWAGSSGMDLRFETPLAQTGTCGERTRYYGLFGPDRITAGDPDQSGILMRMNAEGLARMPPIGMSVIDPAGADVLRRWIRSLETCPSE